MVQTVAQHSLSAQFGLSWGARHEPAAGAPHSSTSVFANSTHASSHAIEQHSGSAMQTASQTAPFEQEGVGCATKHDSFTSPQSEQNFLAIRTQTSSHALSQHDGSTLQTSWQQTGLLHPGAKRFAS